MVTLRCTAKLLQRLGKPLSDAPVTGNLGDWYANIIATRPRHLALCTNERTLLCVVVPVAPATRFLDRFITAARHRIDQISAPPEARLREMRACDHAQLGRTASRSVLSSMNQFAYSAESWLEEQPAGDLEELGLWLCDTPCFPLKTTWPWLEAELLLTGQVAPGHIGLRSLDRVPRVGDPR